MSPSPQSSSVDGASTQALASILSDIGASELLQNFIDDEDCDEVPEFEVEDYVIACNVHPDGVITTDHGVFFDPKTLSK